MNLATPDTCSYHLYPAFESLVLAVLKEAQAETQKWGTARWTLIEGYRSTARQAWLYGQGRKPPVQYARAGQVVTRLRVPTHHGYGLAADVAPIQAESGQVWWDAPMAVWRQLRHVAHMFGLVSGQDWRTFGGDLGHIEPKTAAYRVWKPKAIVYLHGRGLRTP